jgi:transposase
VLWMDESSFHIGLYHGTIDWIWRSSDEEYHIDYIDFKKWESSGIIFWGVFRWGKMDPGIFFRITRGEYINSTIYHNQILLGSLQDFWIEIFLDIRDPIIMEDNIPVYKGVCIKVREEMGCIIYPHPPNSPDLNPIENIWVYIKYRIIKEYPFIISKKELEWVII